MIYDISYAATDKEFTVTLDFDDDNLVDIIDEAQSLAEDDYADRCETDESLDENETVELQSVYRRGDK